jgi:hypothetical protein
MSGYPLNYPSDASKLRQNYLANLSLEANINDMNLQANKIFKKTGQTPTQPTDSRTTAEKLADIERLKIEVRGELTPIADGTQADAIVQALQPNELQFLAQHIEEIVKIIKPKYKYGVLSDVFVPFLRAYIDKAEATDEVDFGLQQTTGDRLIMGMNQIADTILNAPTLGQIQMAIDASGRTMEYWIQTGIARKINELRDILPDKQFLIDVSKMQDQITKTTIQQSLNDALQEMPTKRQIEILLQQLNQATARRDKATADDIGAKLNQLLTVQPATEEQLREVKKLVEESRAENLRLHIRLQELYLKEPEKLKQLIQDEIASLKTSNQQVSVAMRGQIINDVVQAIKQGNIENKEEMAQFIGQLLQAQTKGPAQQGAAGEPPQASVMAALPAGQVETEIRSLYKPITHPTLDSNSKRDAYINRMWKYAKGPNENKGDFLIQFTGKKQPKSKDELNNAIREINRRLRPIGWGEDNPVGVGEGIHRIKGRGIIADNADYSEGVMSTNHYVPFGRFFINTHKLNDNIIAIKRPTGGNISGMPVERITSGLGEVLRTITGGGQPNFHQLEKLSQDEKVYLHKIAKHSNILDRLSIPTPNKDDDDKDINQFEIMKGEVLAGNDSTELVKKFKLLIIKMTKKDLLPKGHAKELLLELATLGY